MLASSKHVRTEHSFYAYFYLYNISSTICIFLDLLIALILTSGALDISYLDTRECIIKYIVNFTYGMVNSRNSSGMWNPCGPKIILIYGY